MPELDNKHYNPSPKAVCLRILSHWNQPAMIKEKDGDLFNTLIQFSQPDTEIDNLLKLREITPPHAKGEDNFFLEFRMSCRLAKLLISRPQKDDLKRSHKTRTRKLKKLLNSLNDELKSYTKEEFAYIADIIQQQADYMLEASNEPKIDNLLPEFCRKMTTLRGVFHLHDSAEENLQEIGKRDECQNKRIMEGWEGSPELYLRNFEGGHGEAKSRKAALCAIAESYWRCFGKMPTSSENSTFMKYGTVLYEYLNMGTDFESSLYQDAKTAIKKIKPT